MRFVGLSAGISPTFTASAPDPEAISGCLCEEGDLSLRRLREGSSTFDSLTCWQAARAGQARARHHLACPDDVQAGQLQMLLLVLPVAVVLLLSLLPQRWLLTA